MTLEELLNKLIKRGWKPFNVNCAWTNVEVINRLREDNYYIPEHTKIIFKTDEHWHVFDCNIRDLVSKSSGLWQFCVENKLVNMYADLGSDVEEAYIGKRKSGLDAVDINGDYIRLDDDYDEYHQDTDYKYWIIECSLLDERDLEKFLLSNIKVEGANEKMSL